MSELILRRKDNTEETITWDQFNALAPTLNPTKHVGTTPLPTRVELTDAKVSEREAKEAAQEAAEATAQILGSIYAPFVYDGNTYPMDESALAKYDAMRNKRGRSRVARSPVKTVDGVVKMTAAQLDAFLDAVDNESDARIEAAHDNLP